MYRRQIFLDTCLTICSSLSVQSAFIGALLTGLSVLRIFTQVSLGYFVICALSRHKCQYFISLNSKRQVQLSDFLVLGC